MCEIEAREADSACTGIVILSPVLPSSNPDNAGERYVRDLVRALADHHPMVIAPDSERNRRASREQGAPRHHLVELVDPPLKLRPANDVREAFRRVFPVRPINGFMAGLQRDDDARRIIRSARLIDLQWQTMAPLLPRLRRWNRSAEVVITLHDVMSQQIGRRRSAAVGWKKRIKETLGFVHAHRVERWLSRRAERIVVFSDKDRALLPSWADPAVVHPPLAAEQSTLASRNGTGRANALFIGPLHRAENYEGVLWLTTEVWPLVLAELPDATLTVAGKIPESLRPTLPELPGIEYVGFVDDLDAVYAATDIAVAPLFQGAGVKFKVIDAIARGVPVALTSVGAEGIGDEEFTVEPIDAAERFAAVIIEAMSDPLAAREAAQAGADWASKRYGAAQFADKVRSIYGEVAIGEERIERRAAERPSGPPHQGDAAPRQEHEGGR